MKIAFIDFETYWDDKHTLKKMTPLEYVSHEKTELQACCLLIGGQAQVRFGETAIRAMLSHVDWSDTAVVAHNMSGFDALLLTRRLGIQPKMFLCTLAMARPIHAKTCGLSLGKLVERYGIGVKDATALLETKGKKLAAYSPSELDAMRDYVMADTKQCAALFHILKKHYTPRELWHIDATIRMLVEPRFVCDIPLLEQTLDEERQAKLEALKSLARQMMTPDELVVAMFDGRDLEAEVKARLMSAHKFATLLESRGVEVPLKVSPSDPKKTTYALARTDEAFIALQDHEDPVVAAAARTRLQVKSTLLETRIEAYLSAARVSDGLLPIPLHYCGADTSGRWSGWLYNPQNPPRIPRDSEGNIIPKRTNALRMAMRAPRGYKVVVADLSGIELRVNLMLWKVPYVMELLAQDPTADLYKPLASEVLGVPIEGMPKMVRQAGKAMHLGCGFGLGSTVKYQAVARTMAGIEVSTDEADTHIKGYRRKHPEVVGGWRRCHDALHYILLGDRFDIDPWGMCYTERGAIVLPSGRRIRYPALSKTRLETGKTEWTYGCGRHEARIYAGKIDENCVAEGTEVLTDDGWVPVERVGPAHLVHDGVEFVRHEGTINKSVQTCIEVDGVWMTPDHEVLTDDGWKEASQVQRPYRPDLRGVNCAAPGAVDGKIVEVAVRMPMRATSCEARLGREQGDQARRNTELRMSHQATHLRGKPGARDEQAPGVRRIPFNDRSLSTAIASRLEKLRWSGYRGMRAVASVLRELLGGHGAGVPARAGAGSGGQRWPVLAGELPVGRPQDQYHEQTCHDTRGGCRQVERADGDWQDHALQPHSRWVASGGVDEKAVSRKQVYDILNCGPRHRFVVRGKSGPLVVHNCVQALARDVLADAVYETFRETGHRPVHSLHDEPIYIIREDEAVSFLEVLQRRLRTPPRWWPELVTWSEGDIADSYGEAK